MDLIQYSPHDRICRRVDDYISPVADIQRGRGQGDARIRIEFNPKRTYNVLRRFLAIRKEPKGEKMLEIQYKHGKSEDLPRNPRKPVRTFAQRHTRTSKQAHCPPI